MSRRNSCVSDDSRRSRSRPASQQSRRSPHSPHPSSYNKSSDKLATSQAHKPSPLKMVTTTATASHTAADGALHYYLPDTNTREIEFQKQGWLEPIVIDDDDLMFGGKSLSAWYEEERKSVSCPVEEEQRGRQRVRQHYSHSEQQQQHHHHHHHQLHHHQHHQHQHQHHHHHHRHHANPTGASADHEHGKH